MNEISKEEDEGIAGINIAPLVDVCLVLLLIFMVTSSTFTKSLIPVNVPKAVTSRAESQENITLSISPEHGYELNEIPLVKSALEQELRRHIEKSGISYVLIRADERVPHGDVEDVMKMSRRAGAGKIAFATLPKD